MNVIVLICAVIVFASGYGSCYLIHVVRETPDQCEPALEQLKEAAAPEIKPKKEVHKPVMRRQWSEDMPAKDAN